VERTTTCFVDREIVKRVTINSWGRVTNKMRGEAHLSTTTMGLSVFVRSPKPFHIMRPLEITVAKLRT